MTDHRLPPFREFASLCQALDDHAPQLLAVLQRIAPLLYDGAAAPEQERHAGANKLEQFRYRCLIHEANQPTEMQRRLIDALDLAALALRQGSLRLPRNPRGWIHHADPLEWLEKALDPATGLEEVIAAAQQETQHHFGLAGDWPLPPGARWRMRLYAPLYLSSFCTNHCVYCHFRFPNELNRKHLDIDTALQQAHYLAQRGFRNLLLVAGDFPRLTSTDYFAEITRALTARGFQVSVEVAAQSTAAYAQLGAAGACGVTLYQETYQREAYALCHPRGAKAWFDWRLEGPERAAEAGIGSLGLGILLGLANPWDDLRALAAHAHYLLARFPHLKLAFSLPRLHDAPAPFVPQYAVDDETFLRFYCALRLSFPTAELVLSTRERPELRNRLAAVCITRMSAESCTSPGGYGVPQSDAADGRQFPIQDERTAAETTTWLVGAGFHVSFGD